jgi:hypothetical protein
MAPDIWGHPHIPLTTGQTTPSLIHLTIMTLAGATADRAKASRADVEHPSRARRNRAEVVVVDEIGVYHCVQRVVRRAFLCGVDPLSGNSYDHRRTWIRDRLESLAGLFGVERGRVGRAREASAGPPGQADGEPSPRQAGSRPTLRPDARLPFVHTA